MKNSVDSEGLIADVREDIELFGKSFRVYAIYSFKIENGQEFEWISSYVDAEKPERDEAENEEEYQQLLSEYESNISSLINTKNESMTLENLLEKLIEQDRII